MRFVVRRQWHIMSWDVCRLKPAPSRLDPSVICEFIKPKISKPCQRHIDDVRQAVISAHRIRTVWGTEFICKPSKTSGWRWEIYRGSYNSTQTGTWSPGHLGPMVHQSTADKMASQLPSAQSETKASASDICEESGKSLFFSLKWKNRDPQR